MIAFTRTVNIKPGKTGAAMAFAKQIAAFMKSNYQIDMEVLRPIGGNPQRVTWSSRYADLAAWDSATSRMLADPKYWELVNPASENFIEGTIMDNIWQTV